VNRWTFLSVLVLVAGAVTAFAIRTFGPNDENVQASPTASARPTNDLLSKYWREEWAALRLNHSRWAVDLEIIDDSTECLGVGAPNITGGVQRYRRFDCKVVRLDDAPDRLATLGVTGLDSFNLTPK
jgi:hypothetical protein